MNGYIHTHPGRGGHPPALVSRVCELIEEEGLSFAQTAKALGLTRYQVAGIAHRNGAKKPEPIPAPKATHPGRGGHPAYLVAEVLRRLRDGEKQVVVCFELNLTKGQVAGIAHRNGAKRGERRAA